MADIARSLEELQRTHLLAVAPQRRLGCGDAGMSVQAMSWAIEQQHVADPTARHVLLVLANYAGKTGRGAYPSVGTLARETGLSERTVQSKLKHLLSSGLIAFGNQGIAEVDLEGKPRRNGYRVNVYDLNLGMQQNRGEVAAPLRGESGDAKGVNLTAPGGVNLTQLRGEPAAPDPKALDPRALKASKNSTKNLEAEVAPLRTLDLTWPEEWELEQETVEDYAQHCVELGKALTATAWKVTCQDLHELWESGVDLNEALRRTMQIGRVIPVDPTRGKKGVIARRQRDQQRQSDADVRMVQRTMPPGVLDCAYRGTGAAELLP